MLNLKTGKTVSIEYIDDNGQKGKIDISSKISEIIPQMTTPSWIDIVSNTSAPNVRTFSNVQIRALAKSEPTVAYINGAYVQNPGSLAAKTIETKLVQFSPEQIIDKVKVDEIDLQIDGFENVLAKYAGTWLAQIRKEFQILALNMLCFAAQEFQKKIENENNNFTTFDRGAHVERIQVFHGDDAYNLLSRFKSMVQKIGLITAQSNIDKNFKFSSGINLEDVVLICNSEFVDIICSKPGVFASEPGFELFKKMGIVKLLGMNIIPTVDLPNGVYFLAFTTGLMGALAYNSVADDVWFNLKQAPEWSKHQILEISKKYYLGVAFEQLCFMACDRNTIINNSNVYGKAVASSKIVENTQFFNSKPGVYQETPSDYRGEEQIRQLDESNDNEIGRFRSRAKELKKNIVQVFEK